MSGDSYNHGYRVALNMVNVVLWGAGRTSDELLTKAVEKRDARVRKAALEEVARLLSGPDWQHYAACGTNGGLVAAVLKLAEQPGPELDHWTLSRAGRTGCESCGSTKGCDCAENVEDDGRFEP